MISPGDFIPLFEGNGLISVVDSYVWAEAARQVAVWRERYGFTLPVSVNLSRTDLFDPTLTERLRNLIEANGLRYQDIKLEVTESAYTENARQLLELIHGLRVLGFEVEMDDFGSGYSSLNMLSSMPIDVLKMDMKFVRNIENSETDFRLVKLILDIARYLNLSAVAEGVETEGQLRLLQGAGCDLVQGFYFSRPLPPQEFERLIQQELSLERKEQE
jgi:EAL domain-containing protein (putative c-di-GMP-specific phosphodiesterase class I)